MPNTDLARFHGRCRDGWTDDDIAGLLTDLSELVGVELYCLWDYVDAFGFGGDSQLVRRTSDGLVEAPSALYDLLAGRATPERIDLEDDGELVVADDSTLVTSDLGPNLAFEQR